MKPPFTAKAALFALIGMATVMPSTGAPQGDTHVPKTAKEQIESFKRGENFDSSRLANRFVCAYRVRHKAVSPLIRELEANADGDVRRKLVELLKEIGLQANAPAPDKFAVIQDHIIIKALVREVARQGGAAAEAESALLEKVKPSDLAAYNSIFTESLKRHEGTYLQLAAKAKTLQARAYVEQMAALPAWKGSESAQIAQAALGNTRAEGAYIAAVYEAERTAPPAKHWLLDVKGIREGSQVAEKLRSLGLIGTRRSLQVACAFLRSPLMIYNHLESSVRTEAARAILYNFPDEQVLFDVDQADKREAAERFCAEHLGAVFVSPTPDLPQVRAVPSLPPDWNPPVKN